MQLLIQPRDGSAPLIAAIKKARKSIELVIFRFDRNDIERALHAAVGRGVQVHALIAHTNQGGAARLRKLELDKRREVGVFVKGATIVKELIATFETDWAQTGLGREREEQRHEAVETVTPAAAAPEELNTVW